MTSTEYRQSLDALSNGNRLHSAVYLIDPGEDGMLGWKSLYDWIRV